MRTGGEAVASIRASQARASASIALAAMVVSASCGNLPHLASGPIDLGPAPTLVRFDAAVRAALDEFTLCFEFERPGASDEAKHIVATFLTPSQRRYTFADSDLDRRGELIVCRIGRMAPAGETPASEPPQSFSAVELSAGTPLRLRRLRGGATAEAS
jgi:hypothetical protein